MNIKEDTILINKKSKRKFLIVDINNNIVKLLTTEKNSFSRVRVSKLKEEIKKTDFCKKWCIIEPTPLNKVLFIC